MKLKVEDFSKSKIDWQIDFYEEEGVNIGISFYEDDDMYNQDIMYDQDILDSFPIFNNLNLGIIMSDDNGFLALDSNLSVADIKIILISNGFEVL